MKTFLWVLLAGVVVSTPVFAHHGNAAFDAGKKLELKGTVTEWTWGLVDAGEFPDYSDVWATPTVARIYDANCDGRAPGLDRGD